MIILKESNKKDKLNEGVSVEQIQKKVLVSINKEAAGYSAMRAQSSSPQKVYLGVCIAYLRAVAQGVNPMQNGNYPFGGKSPKLDDDVQAAYKKYLIPAIQQMSKIYEMDYGDNLW
jgi:hypothetical protein